MSKLFRRLRSGVKARMEELMAPAEDPRQSFIYAYERQRTLLVQVRQALTEVGRAKRRLQEKVTELQGQLPQMEDQARRCLGDNREDLARLALQRRQLALIELTKLSGQLSHVEQEEQRLSLTEQRLSSQLEAFYARQELLAAQTSAAEAQVQIGEALTGVSEELARLGQAMEQAEAQSQQMQARAAAIDRLVGQGWLEAPGGAGDFVSAQLDDLGYSQEIENQLGRLKAEVA